MLNPLEMAIAHEYARKEYERRGKRRHSRRGGWAMLFWIFGIGFLI